jgi:Bacterial regulatory proteins, luxR family
VARRCACRWGWPADTAGKQWDHPADRLRATARRVRREFLNNREIGQALFVISKTVEAHVSRTYLKLNVIRRLQVSRALAGGARLV